MSENRNSLIELLQSERTFSPEGTGWANLVIQLDTMCDYITTIDEGSSWADQVNRDLDVLTTLCKKGDREAVKQHMVKLHALKKIRPRLLLTRSVDD